MTWYSSTELMNFKFEDIDKHECDCNCNNRYLLA